MVPPSEEANLAEEQWKELADGFNELQTNLFQGAYKSQVPWKDEPYVPPVPPVKEPEPEPEETEADEKPPAAEAAASA